MPPWKLKPFKAGNSQVKGEPVSKKTKPGKPINKPTEVQKTGNCCPVFS